MKAIIKFRNYEKGSKVLPLSTPEKIANVLCDTKVGNFTSYFLYHIFGIKEVVFK